MERLPIRACTTIQQYVPRSTPVPTPPSPQYIWKSTTRAICRPSPSIRPAHGNHKINHPTRVRTKQIHLPQPSNKHYRKQGHSHNQAHNPANRSRIPPTKKPKTYKLQHMDRRPSRKPINLSASPHHFQPHMQGRATTTICPHLKHGNDTFQTLLASTQPQMAPHNIGGIPVANT